MVKFTVERSCWFAQYKRKSKIKIKENNTERLEEENHGNNNTRPVNDPFLQITCSEHPLLVTLIDPALISCLEIGMVLEVEQDEYIVSAT